DAELAELPVEQRLLVAAQDDLGPLVERVFAAFAAHDRDRVGAQDVAHALRRDHRPRVAAHRGDRPAREALVDQRFVPHDLLPLAVRRNPGQFRADTQSGEAVDDRRIDQRIGVIEGARRIEDAAVQIDLLGGAVHQSAAGGRPPRADPQFLQAAPQQVEVLLRADEHATRAPGQTLVHEGHRRGVLLVVRLEREAQVAAVANVGTDYRWTHAND